jgi:hypothetical protein
MRRIGRAVPTKSLRCAVSESAKGPHAEEGADHRYDSSYGPREALRSGRGHRWVNDAKYRRIAPLLNSSVFVLTREEAVKFLLETKVAK